MKIDQNGDQDREDPLIRNASEPSCRVRLRLRHRVLEKLTNAIYNMSKSENGGGLYVVVVVGVVVVVVVVVDWAPSSAVPPQK